MIAAPAPERYLVQLPQFEGPFDLLLFFIERDELDIHDIPIAKLTNDFLNYIHTLESMNIEVASEFILVAATLMKIKAKMLIPRPTILEDGTIEDPRTELVNRLLEYKRYKEAVEQLKGMEEEMEHRFRRGYALKEEKELLKSDLPEEELLGIDLYAIMKAYKRVMEKNRQRLEKPKHVIRRYPYTLDQLKGNLIQRLQKTDRIDFISFVVEKEDKVYVVFGFLAILEMVQRKQVRVVLGEGYNNFWMEMGDPEEAAAYQRKLEEEEAARAAAESEEPSSSES